MKYLIMLLVVVGMALTDFLTGYIKAYGKNEVNSRKMRIGGLNKVCEIFVMGSAIGLNVGLEQLGIYYNSRQLTEISGAVTAIGVFTYIVLMEIVSVLENLSEIFPDAAWIGKLIKRFRLLGGDVKDKNEEE
jgi:phage-related holin